MYNQHRFDNVVYNGGKMMYARVPTYMKTIAWITNRKGTGTRVSVTYTKKSFVVSVINRLRSVTSMGTAVITQATRIGKGSRKSLSSIKSIFEKLMLPHVNVKVWYEERRVELEVEE